MNIYEVCAKCCQSGHSQLTACHHCGGTIFCQEHISPYSHNCSAIRHLLLVENEASDHSALLQLQSYNCSSDGCSECGPMKLECCMCGKHYCSFHRKHGCIDPLKKELIDKRERREVNRNKFKVAKDMIDLMVETTIERQRSICGSKLATANKIQLMRLKQRAVGRRDIPFSNRAYFMVHWTPHESNEQQRKAIYVSKTWAISQVIQTAAEQFDQLMNNKFVNVNDLRLFDMDGRLLTEDLSLILEELLFENVIFDGGNVLVDKFH